MLKTIIKLVKPNSPGSEFERYMQKLQRLDADGAPTREQAKRDFRDLQKSDYNHYTLN